MGWETCITPSCLRKSHMRELAEAVQSCFQQHGDHACFVKDRPLSEARKTKQPSHMAPLRVHDHRIAHEKIRLLVLVGGSWKEQGLDGVRLPNAASPDRSERSLTNETCCFFVRSPQAYPNCPGVHVSSPHTLSVTSAIEHPGKNSRFTKGCVDTGKSYLQRVLVKRCQFVS